MSEMDIKVYNVKDDTEFGYDVTEDRNKVWYFIQADILGDGKSMSIWNPNNMLRSYQSLKEALFYLGMANEKRILPASKYRIVRSCAQYDYKNIEVINTENEVEYYAQDLH